MLGDFLRQLLGRRTPRSGPNALAPAETPARETWLAEAARLQALGRHREVADMARAALDREPNSIDALQLMGAALLAQGNARDGIASLRRASALSPESAEIQATLAAVLARTGDLAGAIEAYRQAAHLRPEFADAWASLAWLLKAVGRYDAAEDACRSGLLSSAQHAMLRRMLAGALFEQARLDEALVEARTALAIDPAAADAHSDLLRMLNYADGQDPVAVYREHVAWDERHARPLADATPHRNDPHRERRLRVGFVSPWFRKHAMTFFFESFVEHHDSARMEVVLYADVDQPDDYSTRLQSYGVVWRSTVGLDDAALARLVREDRTDILVDLSGHTARNRLLAFARRPAPIQVTWNGYPNTTGMKAMDYRITDALCDPPGRTEGLHSEALVRLPGIYMTWRPPADALDPGPLPARAAGHVTFGSFNSCFKITPTTVSMWSDVLVAVPGSRLRIFTVTGARAAAHLRRQFASCGIGPERLEIEPRLSHESFLAAHRDVDIALDSFPYHGTTTTCFSLWMGLPVVVLAGETHVSRVGLSLLSSIGLDRLAASTSAEYVRIAARLAQDLDALEDLRNGLRGRLLRSALTDGASCASAFADACETMWRSWYGAAREP